MAPVYCIVVKKEGKLFKLFNENSGQFAGDRYRKGETEKLVWPFHGKPQWWQHEKAEDAAEAAKKLQTYLDACEAKKAKTKKGEE